MYVINTKTNKILAIIDIIKLCQEVKNKYKYHSQFLYNDILRKQLKKHKININEVNKKYILKLNKTEMYILFYNNINILSTSLLSYNLRGIFLTLEKDMLVHDINLYEPFIFNSLLYLLKRNRKGFIRHCELYQYILLEEILILYSAGKPIKEKLVYFKKIYTIDLDINYFNRKTGFYQFNAKKLYGILSNKSDKSLKDFDDKQHVFFKQKR